MTSRAWWRKGQFPLLFSPRPCLSPSTFFCCPHWRRAQNRLRPLPLTLIKLASKSWVILVSWYMLGVLPKTEGKCCSRFKFWWPKVFVRGCSLALMYVLTRTLIRVKDLSTETLVLLPEILPRPFPLWCATLRGQLCTNHSF